MFCEKSNNSFNVEALPMRFYFMFSMMLLMSVVLSACSTTSNTISHVSIEDTLRQKKSVLITSDGVDQGETAYHIIREVLGEKSIESPDLYEGDNQGVVHIVEATDDVVGDHFVMKIYRDLDGNKGEFKGRQRNEIKVYNGSDDGLKGYENRIFSYRWKMKVNTQMEVSKNFTHLFQIKPKGGDDSTPTLTITGAERRGKDVLEVRHFSPRNRKTVLASIPWSDVQGEWLDIYCRALYSDNGWLEFTINKMSDHSELVTIYVPNLDMWVGTQVKHYQRPKWGIVRSIVDLDNLRAEEERVHFSDIEITRWD